MTNLELKNQVKERIDLVNNTYLLEEILNLLDFESEDNEIFVIPNEHLQELDKSVEQMKNGKTISNDLVNLKVQKWLSR